MQDLPFFGPEIMNTYNLEKGVIYYYIKYPWLNSPFYLTRNTFLARHDGYFSPPSKSDQINLVFTTLDGVQHTIDKDDFDIYAYVPPELDQFASGSPLADQYLAPYRVLGGDEGVHNAMAKIMKKLAIHRRGPVVNFFYKQKKRALEKEQAAAGGGGGGSTGGRRKTRYRKTRRRRRTIRK